MRLLYEQLTDIPSGFTEVEYLASNGNQWIDTEYKMQSGKTSTFEGNIMWTASQGTANFFYGYRSVNSAEYRGDMRAFFIYGASPAGRLAIRYGVNTDNSTQVAVSLNTNYKISFDGDNLKVDDVTYATLSQAYTPANYQNMWLFNCNTTGYYSADVSHFIGRIYNWKIFSDGELVRDFVPCLDTNNVPCMWDKVEGKAYYNKGTGSFTYGRKIIPVEYIESSGTQYINTGFKGKNNLHYKTKVNFTTLSTGSSNGIGGEYLGNASAYIGMVRANGHFTYLFNNTAVETTTTFYTNTDYVIDSTMNTGNQVVKVNGETISTGTLSGTFTSTRNIFLFAICSTNEAADVYGSLKMYYCQIYDNDILVRDFIPCIDENNNPYMFDKVTHTAYLNAGTGSFIVGNELPRKKLRLIKTSTRRLPFGFKEVEYLEATGTQYINTGYIPNINTECSMNLAFVSLDSTYRTPFSVRTADGATNSFTIMSVNSQQSNNSFAFGSSYWSGSSVPSVVLNKTVKAVLRKGYASWDGVSGSPGTSITPTSLTAYMFARNANGTAANFFKGRIYDCKIKENDTLVYDFIPCLDTSNVPCMYDLVEGKAYYNAGTGAFVVGDEIKQDVTRFILDDIPNIYQKVEYLQSTGTQYIDTEIKPNNNTIALYNCAVIGDINNKDSHIFGSRLSASSEAFDLAYMNTTPNGLETLRFISGSAYTQVQTPLVTATTIKNNNAYYMSSIQVKVNGTQVLSFTTSAYQGTYNLWLFGVNNAGTLHNQVVAQKVYGCKIWNNNTITRDFIPVIRKSDSKPGMYDRVTKQFFTNAGTGEFTYS